MTKIKICGITNAEDARLALELGADELGLNFYEASRRRVAPDDAKMIVDGLAISRKIVGVFVNRPIAEVVAIAGYVGLDGIQLHGDEDRAYVLELRNSTDRFIIKAFAASPQFQTEDATDWPIDFSLFDAYSSNDYGGTGRTFDWGAFVSDIHTSSPSGAYLAGGLTADNVSGAIRIVRPYAVDVASGVESEPGKKDAEKMKRFFAAVREAV